MRQRGSDRVACEADAVIGPTGRSISPAALHDNSIDCLKEVFFFFFVLFKIAVSR